MAQAESFPRRRRRIMVVVAAWISAITMSTIPTVIRNENQYFYDVSEVCIGLPLARDVYYHLADQTFNITYQTIDRNDDPVHFKTFHTLIQLQVHCTQLVYF